MNESKINGINNEVFWKIMLYKQNPEVFFQVISVLRVLLC